MPIEINMREDFYMDIYDRMSRNRKRLVLAAAAFCLALMAFSGLVVILLREVLRVPLDPWLLWAMFWLLCLLYVLIRYALGGMWVLKGIKILPSWKVDRRLEDALMAACLASGSADRMRLFEIPDDDINSFSLSLPDGTFALFATSGIASKLPHDERVAVFAHEIAHMQAGDTTIYTIMIRLAGTRSLRRMVGGLPGATRDPVKSLNVSIFTFLLAAAAILLVVGSTRDPGQGASSGSGFWFTLAVIFLALLAILPIIANTLLRLVLDRNREYSADMHAVYIMRDPAAVYGAVKEAAEDVRDVILLPACFDALLFHPVVDYSSYRPFRTQPAMSQRMARLSAAFPIITV